MDSESDCILLLFGRADSSPTLSSNLPCFGINFRNRLLPSTTTVLPIELLRDIQGPSEPDVLNELSRRCPPFLQLIDDLHPGIEEFLLHKDV